MKGEWKPSFSSVFRRSVNPLSISNVLLTPTYALIFLAGEASAKIELLLGAHAAFDFGGLR
jgi:hypothetical protein